MILQYKGIGNNWCYEEAERIICATVDVSKETKDYRVGGVRYKIHQDEIKEKLGFDKSECDLSYVREMHNAVDNVIRKETSSCTDIVYIIGKTPFDQLESVSVVMLEGKDVHATYVFDSTHSRECTVYLLNSNGGTVLRVR